MGLSQQVPEGARAVPDLPQVSLPEELGDEIPFP